MLFEKSKEKSKIRTWYHKSFLSTSRVSELGREEEIGRRGAGRVMRYRATSTLYQHMLASLVRELRKSTILGEQAKQT